MTIEMLLVGLITNAKPSIIPIKNAFLAPAFMRINKYSAALRHKIDGPCCQSPLLAVDQAEVQNEKSKQRIKAFGFPTRLLKIAKRKIKRDKFSKFISFLSFLASRDITDV